MLSLEGWRLLLQPRSLLCRPQNKYIADSDQQKRNLGPDSISTYRSQTLLFYYNKINKGKSYFYHKMWTRRKKSANPLGWRSSSRGNRIQQQLSAVLWIRIHLDPHSFGCLASGSVLRMRIRIQQHGNLPKFKNKPGFLPFKKAFVPSYVCFLTYYQL